MKSYYQAELDRLDITGEFCTTIKLTDGSGNSTRVLNLNEESIPALIEFLKNLEQELIGKRKGVTHDLLQD